MDRKIILDRIRSNTLLDVATPDGATDVLTHGIENTLLAMVLFDGAEITVENHEERQGALERLKQEDIAHPVPRQTFLNSCRLVDNYLGNTAAEPGSESSFTAVAQEKSFEAIWPLISENCTDLKPFTPQQASHIVRNWGGEFSTDSGFFDLNFGNFYDQFDVDTSYGLPSAADYQIHPDAFEDYFDRVLSDLPAEQKARYKEDMLSYNEKAPEILSQYVEMRGLTERARLTGFPIATRIGDQKFPLDMSLGSEALQLCRFHLNEVRSVPYLETLDDVLRLRQHRYIRDFQDSIFEWLSRIAEGETEIEARYRQHIRTANKEIEKLEKWKVLNSPFTLAASVTVGVAEVFTGTFFGFGFAAASAAAMLEKRRVSKEYGYALFRPS